MFASERSRRRRLPRLHRQPFRRVAPAASAVLVASTLLALPSCGSPTAPGVPIAGQVMVSVSPPTLVAQLVGIAPFQWTASWTVNVAATGAQGPEITQVTTRIESSDSTALALVSNAASGRPAANAPIQVSQTATWVSPASPPATARLMITVFLADGGATERVATMHDVAESLCGGRGQIGCDGASIGLNPGGISPKSVEIMLGQFVSFTNLSGVPRNLRSDPHPSHDGCPELNGIDLGVLLNGMSAPFLTPGTCTYHDETDPTDAAFQAEVIVKSPFEP